MTQPHSQQTITPDTNVPIKVIVPIISAIIVVSMWVNTKLNSIEAGIHESWRIKDMQKWTTIMRDSNPTLHVPSPYDTLAEGWKMRPSAPSTASTQ